MKDIILFGIILLLSVINGEFVVPSFVSAQLGDEAKLECKLIGNYRWYAISWKKIDFDGTEKLIVTLPIDTREPDWNTKTRGYYSARYSPVLNMNGERTEFSLKVKGLLCSDRGHYACDVVGNFPEKSKSVEVSVGSSPEKPVILFDKLIVERNTTFDLTCEAKVGVPESALHWLHKPSGEEVFRMIPEKEATGEITEETACVKKEISTLRIFITEESDGSIYRCALQGRHNEVDFYDEVKIELAEIITTSSPDAKPECDGTVCLSNVEETKEKINIESSSPIVNISCILLLIAFIINYL